MNNKQKNNLTINIFADDQLRSSNTKMNTVQIESSSVYVLYPQLFDMQTQPSVPMCHKQENSNKNLDRKIEATFGQKTY